MAKKSPTVKDVNFPNRPPQIIPDIVASQAEPSPPIVEDKESQDDIETSKPWKKVLSIFIILAIIGGGIFLYLKFHKKTVIQYKPGADIAAFNDSDLQPDQISTILISGNSYSVVAKIHSSLYYPTDPKMTTLVNGQTWDQKIRLSYH